MPLYEYRCPYCQKYFEVFMTMSQVCDITSCPVCAHEAHRHYTVPQINFGTGYTPGINGDHDMEVASEYYEKRLYSEDEQKVGVNKNANIQEV